MKYNLLLSFGKNSFCMHTNIYFYQQNSVSMKSSRCRFLVVVCMVAFWRIYWPKAYWTLIWRIFMWKPICIWILNTTSWLFGIWWPILPHVISRSFRIVHFLLLFIVISFSSWKPQVSHVFYLEKNLHFVELSSFFFFICHAF